MDNTRVVITGMGVVAPNGTGLADFEAALKAGKSGIRFLPEMERLNFGCQVGGVPEVSEELRQRYFSAILLSKLKAEGIVYGVVAAAEAWQSAGLPIPDRGTEQPDWVSGAIFGAGMAAPQAIRSAVYNIDEGKAKRLGGTSVQQTMASGVSAYIGGLLGLGNQVTTNASACTTGTEAIVQGYDRIKAGKAQRMLCGGTDSASPYLWGGFDAMRVLNRRSNDQPEAASRPLSASAKGFVPGGGAGAVLLESLSSARARNAPILAEVIGGYINSGGQRNGGSMTAPNQEGIARCIAGALTDAAISGQKVDAISGHLTATMLDPLEVEWWARTLDRKGEYFPYLHAMKSMTGHCLSASGAIEAVAAVLQLGGQYVPPNLNCEDLHPQVSAWVGASRIPRQLLATELNIIASSSFGFGDTNSVLLLQRFTPDE
ncbi:MAG: beta-ketoacyl-[acyl-carrier-protein] synthase family protein [Bacteroidota bacterium]